jgi:hypothetical protein
MAAPSREDQDPAQKIHRSYYMSRGDADRLTALIEDLHFGTRLDKHEILAVVVDVVEQYRPEIEKRIRQGGSRDRRATRGGASR